MMSQLSASLFQWENPVHVQESHAGSPAGIPPGCFSTAMHEPSCQFCIRNFGPVTLSPRYFGAPSYWSLKFI